MTWGFVAAGVAVVGSAAIGYEASRKSSNTQADAAQNAANQEMQMYLTSREDQAKYRDWGAAATEELGKTVMAGPGTFKPEEQPGYMYGYKELVENPLLQGKSAAGKLRSGETLKALSDRAQGYASMSYDNWLNRWLTKMQPLQSLANLGQTSVSTTGQQGITTAANMATPTMVAGKAQADNAITQANILTGAIKGLTNPLLDMQVMNKTGSGSLFNANFGEPR